MKTERAIELLNRISDSQFDGVHGDERREALEMAVRALSGDGDLISRKMAIEAFEPTHYKDWYTPTIIETLETLPSVRPEVLACGNGELVKESNGLVKDLVKDCISRQAAIDDIRTMIPKDARFDIKWIEMWLMQLPSAEPQIIRCENCKHYKEWESEFTPNAVVTQCMADNFPIRKAIPDGWFCAGAERRTDE